MTDWTWSIYTIEEILHRIERGDVPSGFPPLPIGKFTLIHQHNNVVLVFDLPNDTYIKDQVVCTVIGVKVVRKNGSEPKTIEDGTLLADIPIYRLINGSYEKIPNKISIHDEGLPYYETFYYKAFPYSDHHVYNFSSEDNVRSITLNDEDFAYGLYGFHQDFTDHNPNTCIQYLNQMENTYYEPMMTNKNQGRVTDGDWGDFLKNILKNEPAIINCNTGELGYWLKESNYKERKTPLLGAISEAQAVVNTNPNLYSPSLGEFPFSWLNKIYMKETYDSDGNGRTVIFSATKREGFDPIGFVDFDGNELEGLWLPMAYMYLTNPIVDTNQGDSPIYKFKPVMVLNSTDSYAVVTNEGVQVIPAFEVPDYFNIGLCYDEPYAGHSRYYTGRKWSPGSGFQVDGSGYEYITNPLDYFKMINQRMVYLGGPIMNVLRDLQYLLYKTTNITHVAGYGTVLRKASPDFDDMVIKEDTNGTFGFYGGTNIKTTRFHSYVLGSSEFLPIWDPYYIMRTTGDNQYGDQAEKTYQSFMNQKYQIGKADEVRQAWFDFDEITNSADKAVFNGYSTLVSPTNMHRFILDQNLTESSNNYEERFIYPSHLLESYQTEDTSVEVGEGETYPTFGEYGSSTKLVSDATSGTGLCSCQQTNLQKVSVEKEIPEMISVGRLKNFGSANYCPGNPDNKTFEESRNPNHRWLLHDATLVPLFLPPVGYKPY